MKDVIATLHPRETDTVELRGTINSRTTAVTRITEMVESSERKDRNSAAVAAERRETTRDLRREMIEEAATREETPSMTRTDQSIGSI